MSHPELEVTYFLTFVSEPSEPRNPDLPMVHLADHPRVEAQTQQFSPDDDSAQCDCACDC